MGQALSDRSAQYRQPGRHLHLDNQLSPDEPEASATALSEPEASATALSEPEASATVKHDTRGFRLGSNNRVGALRRDGHVFKPGLVRVRQQTQASLVP